MSESEAELRQRITDLEAGLWAWEKFAYYCVESKSIVMPLWHAMLFDIAYRRTKKLLDLKGGGINGHNDSAEDIATRLEGGDRHLGG